MKERRMKKVSALTLMIAAVLGMLFGFQMPTQAAYTGTQELSSVTGGNKELKSTIVYTVNSTTTVKGTSSANGYYLSGNTATIYIAKGATLYVYGGDASGSSGAKAGIKVSSWQNLVITGGGTLYTCGGDGARGLSGSSGSCAHNGGAGGAGGGGGGAAIGTDGASGGYGGSQRWAKKHGGSNGDGNPGGNGYTAYSCGGIHIIGNITRRTYSGYNGNGGGTVSAWDRGGTGGGGGGGQGAVAIGTGGAGGGGGGGGATGLAKSGTDPAGRGGYPGSSWGSSASYGNRGNNSDTRFWGGSGGSRGSSSVSASINSNIAKVPTEAKITVTMDMGIDKDKSTNTGTTEQTKIGTEKQEFCYGAVAMSQIDVPTRLGYVFAGYYTGTNGTGTKIYNADGTPALKAGDTEYLDANGMWIYSKDLTVYAKWTPVTATITLNANGGSGTVSFKQDYDKNVSNIASMKPSRVGYVFNGYYTQKTGGTQVFSANGEYQEYNSEKEKDADKSKHITGAKAGATYDNLTGGGLSQFYKDTTLYAQWAPVKYTIQYYSWSDEAQSDVFVGEQKDVTYGSMTFLSDTDLGITRRHHTFSGWNTYTEQGWNMYKANHKYTGGLTEQPGGVVAIYAVWDPVGQVTVSYKGEGGQNVPVDGIAYDGEAYTIAEQEPNRENYTFVGWNTVSDGSGDYYKAGASENDRIDGKPVKSSLMAASSNITLYAIWKANPTLTYNVNGGVGYVPMEYHEAGKQVALLGSETNKENLPTREGYTLVGWKISKNAETSISLTQLYTMPDKDTVLYADWKVNQLSVNAGEMTDTNGNKVKGAVVGWDSKAKKEVPLTESVNYGQSYTFAVKLDNHYDTANMSVSVSGTPLVRSSKEVGSGESEGYTYYIYKVNSPRANQTIDVTDIATAKYPVSLIANGGVVNTLTSYNYGSKTELPTPEKTGYTFAGWFTDKECTKEAAKETKDAEEDQTEAKTVYYIAENEDGNKVFYAKWEKLQYEVTYDANGGEFAEETETTQEFAYDETKQLLTFEDDALTGPTGATGLLGWATDENADTPDYTNGQYVTNLTSKKEITLYAVWNIPKYTISYDLDGGKIVQKIAGEDGTEKTVESAMSVVTVDSGKNYKLSFDDESVPTKEGYTFTGWEYDGTVYDQDNNKVKVTEDITLKAKWQANSYAVAFDKGDGASGEMDTQKFVYGESQKLTPNAFTHEGTEGKTYYFQGWSLTKDGNVQYVDKEEVQNLTTEADGKVTLYAVWGETARVFVSYNANGGLWSEVPSPVEAKDGKAELSTEVRPTRTGYTFTGWADDKDATEATYKDENLVKGNITANTTVYAVWSKDTYTVNFNSNAGETEETEEPTVTGTMEPMTDVAFGKSVTLTKNAFARTGFVFTGWATSEDGEAIYRDEQTVSNITGNTTLYAVWKENGKVTIFFDATGGEKSNKDSVESGSTVDLTADTYKDFAPTKEGYKFKGWSTEYGNEQKIVTKLENVTETTVLYAIWTKQDSHSVEYKVDGKDYPVDAATYYEGDTVNVNFDAAPAKTGYIFTGWSDGKTIYTADATTTLTMPDSDVTLEAQWTPITYIVKFDKNNNKASGKMEDKEATYGKEISLDANRFTAPTGYEFVGWSTQKDSTVSDYADEAIVENLCEHQDDVITLYAVWKAKEVTITFDNKADDATGGETKETATYGQPLPVLSSMPSRQNYTFDGYYYDVKDENGKTIKTVQCYDENLSAIVTESTFTSDVTLYAKWTPDKYRIVYRDGDGVELKTYKVTFKDSVMIQSASAVGLEIKDGQKVVWRRDNNADDTFKVNQSLPNGFFKDGEAIGTVYLYANVRQDTQHEVTYNANGGGFDTKNMVTPQLIDDGEKATVQFEKLPDRDGYTFAGWMRTYTQTVTTEDGKKKTESKTVTYTADQPEADRQFEVTQPTTLYAKWTPSQYTITYNKNDGSEEPDTYTQEVTRGEKPSLKPNTFTRTGYTFTGWATSKKGSAQYEDKERIQTDVAPAKEDNITLYAVWTAKTCKVHFKESQEKDAPEIADEMEVTYDKTYGNLPRVTKTGYTFAGWYKNTDWKDKVTASTIVSEVQDNTFLYAKWDPNENTAYTVKHYKKQLDGTYTQSDIDQMTGTTGTQTAAKAKSYTGFELSKDEDKKFKQDTINADGSTVIKVYYDRTSMTITYPNNVKGLSFENNPESVLYDDTYSFTITVAEKYDVNTLNVKVNEAPVYGSSKKNSDGTVTVTYIVSNAKKDQVITADVQPVVTDTFNANGGTFEDGKTITTYSGNTGEVIEFKAPERDGYRFAGWATSAYAKTGSSTVKFKGNVTYYAVWEHDENTYVKFNADDATINGAHFVVVGTKGTHAGTLYDAELPTATHNDSKEANHHEFKHWALENKYDATKVTKELKFEENTDVYAIWTYVIGDTTDGSKIIIDDEFKLNDDGSVSGTSTGKDGKLNIIMKDAEGKETTTEVKLPEGNAFTVDKTGTISATGNGNTITRPNGDKITTNGEVTVKTDGEIDLTGKDSKATVKKANGEEITVTGKDSTIKADEAATSKNPIIVKKDGKTDIVLSGTASDGTVKVDADGSVNTGNATITPAGDYTIDKDNKVDLGKDGGKVTLPNEKKAEITGKAEVSSDGTITAPKGTTVKVDNKEVEGPTVVSKDAVTAEVEPAGTDGKGKITGVNEDTEYSTDGGKIWNTAKPDGKGGYEIPDVSGDVTIKNSDGTTTTITVGTKETPEPIKKDSIKADKATAADAKDSKITGVDPSMEYSTDGGDTWNDVTGNEITGLEPGDVLIRTKETRTEVAGNITTITIGVKTTPNPVEAGKLTLVKTTTANAKDASISGVNDSMEYSTDGGKTWTQVTGNTISNLGNGEVQIRVKGTKDANPSAVTKVTITVKDNTNAPSTAGIRVVAADSKKTSNATITGVNSSMEYSKDGGRTWTKVTGDRIAGLGVGQIQIRYAENGTRKASAATTITIGIKSQTKEQKQKNKLALNGGLKVSQSGKVITIRWGKLAEADGYDVYVQYCGKKFKQPTATTTSGNIGSVRVKKVNGKKLKLKANYKVYISAYTVVNGQKITLCKSIPAHVVGAKNKKYSNARNIQVKKSRITLKKRKSTTIKAKTILVNRRKKQLSNKHAAQFRYATSDARIAKVNSKGKITAKKKGTCTIYVYARNGFAKKIKVTVK